jgi:hypothetical protein
MLVERATSDRFPHVKPAAWIAFEVSACNAQDKNAPILFAIVCGRIRVMALT